MARFLDEAGIALLNTAIIMIVAGVIGGAFAQYYGILRKQETVQTLDNHMDVVRAALSEYVIDDPSDDNDPNELRYPCPAPLDEAPGSADYGVAVAYDDVPDPSECENDGVGGDILVLQGSDGSDVYLGRVPVKTLGLDVKYMLDAYQNHMTYAVSQNVVQIDAADPAGAGPALGAIEIIDDADNTILDNAEFALISHGPNGAGTTTINDILIACPAGTTGERQNCLADGDPAVIRYQSGRTNVFGADFYDDKVAFSFVDDEDDKWWRPPNIERRDIVNFRSIGIMGQSAGALVRDPADRFIVADGNMRFRSGNLRVSAPTTIDQGHFILEDGFMFVSRSMQLGLVTPARTCNTGLGAWPDNADEGTIRFQSATGRIEFCKQEAAVPCWLTPGADICDGGGTTCIPTIEYRNVSCPTDQIGLVSEQRNIECDGLGNPDPQPWEEISRDCCETVEDNRSVACTSGSATGETIQTRHCEQCYTSESGAPQQTWCTPWRNESNTCCEVETQQTRESCPDGQIGFISSERFRICDPGPRFGEWTDYEVMPGGYNCCEEYSELVDLGCGGGETGEYIVERSWSCNADGSQSATPTETLVSDTCCPAEREERAISCPDGQIGFISQERFYNCTSGSWSAWTMMEGGDNCAYDDCAPQAGLVWGADPSCTGDITVTRAHDETVTIAGTVDPAEATYICNNGTWEPTGSSVCPVSCPSLLFTWGDSNCSATLPETGHALEFFASDDSGNGQHLVRCYNGTWQFPYDDANNCALEDGECGPATTFTPGYSSPPPSNELCNGGTPDPDPPTTNETTYSWVCRGSGTGAVDSGACTASRTRNGICGTATGNIYTSAPDPGTEDLCASPTTYDSGAGIADNSTNYSWFCNGINGGTATECTASKNVPGECNATTLAGEPYDLPPDTADRCTAGTPVNFVQTATTYDWECSGSTTVSCSVTRNVGAACGLSHRGTYTTAPTSNLCEVAEDITPPVTSNTTNNRYEWTCAGIEDGSDVSCYGFWQRDAVCGTADTGDFYSPPSSDLCDIAEDLTPAVTTLASTYEWTCVGPNGGANDSCDALRNIDGACGGNDGGSFGSLTAGTGGNCADGTTVASFATTATGWTWGCNGINDGANTTATACAATNTNGSCGADGNDTVAGSPVFTDPATPADYCATGAMSAFTAYNSGADYFWRWDCDGSTTMRCYAQRRFNGACGGNSGGSFDALTSGNSGNCSGDSIITGFTDNGDNWTWTCQGSNGGTDNTTCRADKIIYGACVDYTGSPQTAQPTGAAACSAGAYNDTTDVIAGQYSWECEHINAAGATSCTAPKGCAGGIAVTWDSANCNGTLPSGTYNHTQSETVTDSSPVGEATFTCNDGSWDTGAWTCDSGGGGEGCFIAGTMVLMADGTKKPVESLRRGDKVVGSEGSVNTILKNEPKFIKDRQLYAINGGAYFVTAEHPFMTIEGWKSINPKETVRINDYFHEGDVEGLGVGDVLIGEDGEEIEIQRLESRGRYPVDMPVYNPSLDGDQTYYADGFLVHNK